MRPRNAASRAVTGLTAPLRLGRRLGECVREREWPWRLRPLVYERGLVRRDWYYRLRLRNALTRRIRVGFGPTVDGEDTLGVRKWHIDPIVNGINRSRSRYAADIYFPGDDLTRFDIVVIAKHIEAFTPNVLKRLRESGTRLVFDTSDIRYVKTTSGWRDIYADRGAREGCYRPFLDAMDALILASPLQRRDYSVLAVPQAEIARPLLNRQYRRSYAHGGPIRLVWQGHRENLAPMLRLHPIVERLRRDTGVDVRLVYDTSGPPGVEGAIEYTEWKVHRWERALVDADVAVVIKPLDDAFQQRKAPTKVVSYMGAGLPVVCTPSVMDRRVIEHGETGYFAAHDREWYDCLRALVTDSALRQRIGTAARARVLEEFGVKKIVGQYLDLFEHLAGTPPAVEGRGHGTGSR